jgi:hypothetical protein
MKRIQLNIVVSEDKIGTASHVEGFPEDSISSRFELIGIYESLKQKEMEKLKTLLSKKISAKDIKEKEEDDL